MRLSLLLITFSCLTTLSCTKTTTQLLLTPIEDVGCAVEQSIATVGAQGLVAQCGAPLSAAQACIMASIGNANICKLPGVSGITADQLKTAQMKFRSEKVHAQGIVGNLACPVGVSFLMGYLSTAIPASCGCTQSMVGSTLSTVLTAACEGAIPI
jgi:hypothetical protein